MFKTMLMAIMAVCVFAVGNATAQDAVAQRTQNLVAALDKTKYKKKEKKGLSFEFYVAVKNTPAPRSDPSDYSGVYQEDRHRLELSVSPNGNAAGSGYDQRFDGSETMKFTLQDAKVQGSLLTGLKVYENGESRKFEAVFVNRSVETGKNANEIETRDMKFGLGYIEEVRESPSTGDLQNWTNRIFLEQRR